ncbi:MAG: DinB family protein [Planctomycetaceae bacterium]|nr:DinB family protein [Planctomycetaceae bacterium]MCA9111736.1 DinB family protein [Planctomycetaceae bacterium]
MTDSELLTKYSQGPELLRRSINGMTEEQLDAKPILGTFSTRQVVCHIADFEPVYADRLKRVIAEDNPIFFGGDPDIFAARLAYEKRDVDEELDLIDATRRQLLRILQTLSADDFQRTGKHAEDGLLDLRTLLTRITNHIPHHVRFIEQKRQALSLQERSANRT